MKFWVLENKMHDYTRIHLADCSSCNFGKGPRPNHTGCWHGEFTSYQEALASAQSLALALAKGNKNKVDVRHCKRCKSGIVGKTNG